MLGFLPESSTRQNLAHGQKLMQQCPHGSIFQISQWWQDPNMYYAFESKKGARWMADHGGPKKFMKMVEQVVPDKTFRPQIAEPDLQPRCFSCNEPFEYFTKKIPIKVCRCMCGTRVVHPKCFMPVHCPVCNIKMSHSVRTEAIQKL